ncbi:MAG TPA: hypothetical protein ENN07_04075 [candidate division Zixibacteria bacterium]|nr:hypothetical protein [candidate division Zixibacteria bacterium]
MLKKYISFFIISICALVFSCAPRPSFDAVKVLFDELARSEEHFFGNNWKAFDALECAFDRDPDERRAFGLFSTFYFATTEQSFDEVSHIDIRAMVEYMGNLLESTPEGGIIIVGGRDNYRLARFASATKPSFRSVAVINIDFIPDVRYRRHISRKHGIEIPDEVAQRIIGDVHPKLLWDIMLDWFVSSSGRDVYLGMDLPAMGGRKSYFVGQGRLYTESLTDEEHKELVLRLFSEGYSYEHCNSGWGKFSEKANSMVQTYGEGLVYTAGGWFTEGDTASAESLAIVAFERLPHHWQPVNLRFVMESDPSPELLDTLIARLDTFTAKFPRNRQAVALLNRLRERRESG